MVTRDGRSLPGLSRRGKVTIGVIAGVILLFILTGRIVDIWTEVLWYREVDYTFVYTNVLFTRIGLFLVVGAGMGLLVGGNLYLAYRLRPLLRPHSPEQTTLERYRMVLTPRIGLWIGLLGALVGLFAGLTAQGRWADWMLFRNGGDFGRSDPELGVDAGFYVFQYPFLRFLLGVGFAVVVLSLLGALAVYYLYGGVRLQGVGERITTAARAHLSVLVALFVGLKAVAYWLDRRGLMLGDFTLEQQEITGAGAAAVSATLPAKEMLLWIAVLVAIAVLVFANAAFRNLTYPGMALALLALAAVVIGGAYPWVVQTFQVNPTLGDREAPYIAHNIEATRYAFGLENTEMVDYQGANETPPPEMAEDDTLISSIRLLDPEILPQTYTQQQQVRGFYGFGDKLDVVRYEDPESGELVDYVVGLRQIDYDNGLTGRQQQWQNQHSLYSHGFGMVGAPANRVVCNGRPFFVSGFVGTVEEDVIEEEVDEEEVEEGRCQASAGLAQLTPQEEPHLARVYYGNQMSEYAVVGGRDEFDRPTTAGDATTQYQGQGGVEVGSFGRQLLYSIKFREVNFLLSEVVNPESRVLYDRDPRQRVEKVAPFLTVDGDPYPAVVGGRIVWIVDGYTTAETYPYSQRINLQQETADSQVGTGVAQLQQDEINYMRNSVKATVDAYDGTVTLYEFDPEDPVLQAWNQAFGGELVVPRDQVPAELWPHFRYPQDMFKVQRNLLSMYYVQEPGEFFAGTDFWQVPATPASPDAGQNQPPYYLLTQFPGQSEPTFQLTSALSPVERRNLASVVSGAYVPSPEGGELQLQAWTLPFETRIAGPEQAHQDMVNSTARTENNPDGIRQELTLLQTGDSIVRFGNLLSLPYQDGMLYIEPVYVQTRAAEAFPLMQKVLMHYGQYVTLADSLEEGLADLVEQGEAGEPTVGGDGPPEGEPPPAATSPPPAETTPPPQQEPPPDLQAAEERFQQAEQDLADAYENGTFQEIAAALEEWHAARAELERARGEAGG